MSTVLLWAVFIFYLSCCLPLGDKTPKTLTSNYFLIITVFFFKTVENNLCFSIMLWLRVSYVQRVYILTIECYTSSHDTNPVISLFSFKKYKGNFFEYAVFRLGNYLKKGMDSKVKLRLVVTKETRIWILKYFIIILSSL